MSGHDADDSSPDNPVPRRAPTIGAGWRSWWNDPIVLLPKERRILGTLLLLFSSVGVVLMAGDLMGVSDWAAAEPLRSLGYALFGVSGLIAGIQLRSLEPNQGKRLIGARLLLSLGAAVVLSVSLIREYVA